MTPRPKLLAALSCIKWNWDFCQLVIVVFFFGDSPVKYIAQPNSHLQIPKILFECVSFKSRAIYGPPFCSVFSIFMKTFCVCVCVLKIELKIILSDFGFSRCFVLINSHRIQETENTCGNVIMYLVCGKISLYTNLTRI